MKYSLYAAVGLMAAISTIQGATTVTLPAVADTMLHDAYPTNNHGASTYMAVGATGGGGSGGTARGLVRFDLSSIPAGATITSVKLNANVIRTSSGPGSTIELHRMLKGWTEGNKVGDPLHPLIGGGAGAGDVTWSHQSFDTGPWQTEGAGGENDVRTNISSSVFINLGGAYSFPSSPDLLADVQAWRANSSTNFGWLIKSGSEAVDLTARIFSTKEGSGPAQLEVVYDVVSTELRILTFQVSNGNMNLTWTGSAPPYRIERATVATGPWTPFPNTTLTQGSAPLEGTTNFFRVAGQVP